MCVSALSYCRLHQALVRGREGPGIVAVMGHLNLRWTRKGLGYDDELTSQGSLWAQRLGGGIFSLSLMSSNISKLPKNDRCLKRSHDNLKDKFYNFVFGFQLRKLPFCPVSMYPDNSWPSSIRLPVPTALSCGLSSCVHSTRPYPFLLLPVGEWLEANVGSIASHHLWVSP